MAILGTAIGGLIGGFDKKLKLPALESINPTAVQGQTTAGNLQNLGALQELGANVNLFNQQQLQRLQGMALPGGTGQIQQTISSWLKGEIPEDVAAATTRAAAGRAVAGGFGGSGAHANLQLRDLGLNSLNIMQSGVTAAERWLQQSTASQFDVTSMFFTPQQRLGFEIGERDRRYEHSLMDARIKAQANPFAAAMTQAIINDEQQIMEMVGSIGGLMGGGG